MSSDCIFCKIIAGSIPSKKLAETDAAIAIADINPQAPLHALVMPRKHIATLNDLDAKGRRELLPALYDLADQLAREHKGGYRTVINCGPQGGQTVFHLHMHVLGGAQMKGHFGS
jgi:histidine triad (HIT) family protein